MIDLYSVKSILRLLSRICATSIFFIFVVVYFYGITLSQEKLSVLVIIASISEVVILLCNPQIKNTGLLIMFFLYNLMCINGFVIAYYFDDSFINYRSVTSMAYVYNSYYDNAILIGNIVLLVFCFLADLPTNFDKLKANSTKFEDTEGSIIANYIGNGMLLIGTLFLAYVILSNNLMFKNYSDVISITGKIGLYQHSVILTSLAVALVFSGGTIKGVKIGMIIFALTMLLHFSIGNRGEVLYSAVICFALYSIRFKTIKIKHLLIAGGIVIVCIPMVRIMREGKMNLYSFNPMSSFLEVLGEEGFQISSFTYIVNYVEDGHPHTWGMTYFNFLLDFVLRRFHSASPWINTEAYVIKEIMPYDGMGFSMIAELYYNFTTVGACIVYGFFARFIKKLDENIYSNNIKESKKIVLSMIMVEMINLCRNDSSTLAVYLMYGFILYFLFVFISANGRKA